MSDSDLSDRTSTRYAIPVSVPRLVTRFLLTSDRAGCEQWRTQLGDRLGPQDSAECANLVESFLAAQYDQPQESVEPKFRTMQIVTTLYEYYIRIYLYINLLI
jgi:hypothetical protein